MAQHLSKMISGPKDGIGPALRQEQKNRAFSRDPEQTLTQFEKQIEIGSCAATYGDQTILEEFRGLNEQGALFGRVICCGEANAFGNTQSASVEEMKENVAGSKAE
jgi:hypothetical protein